MRKLKSAKSPNSNRQAPRLLRPVSAADLRFVDTVLTDVDGTLTSGGLLEAVTLSALEILRAVGVRVILVSGRPSGWGECWMRQWPVDGAIVENGGLYWVRSGERLSRVYAEAPTARSANRKALRRHVEAALKRVPGARLSTDSAWTEVDMAIDYAEESGLGPDAADALEHELRRRGVTAVRSSVPVNCWLGRFDKLSTAKRFLEREAKMRPSELQKRVVYVGDSFNDAPMFEGFTLSFGVANVLDVWESLDAVPKFVTSSREGAGFRELAAAIVVARTTHKDRLPGGRGRP
jgi:HAD superfamily hydrolase (TIGR01484 family)